MNIVGLQSPHEREPIERIASMAVEVLEQQGEVRAGPYGRTMTTSNLFGKTPGEEVMIAERIIPGRGGRLDIAYYPDDTHVGPRDRTVMATTEEGAPELPIAEREWSPNDITSITGILKNALQPAG